MAAIIVGLYPGYPRLLSIYKPRPFSSSFTCTLKNRTALFYTPATKTMDPVLGSGGNFFLSNWSYTDHSLWAVAKGSFKCWKRGIFLIRGTAVTFPSIFKESITRTSPPKSVQVSLPISEEGDFKVNMKDWRQTNIDCNSSWIRWSIEVIITATLSKPNFIDDNTIQNISQR